jgi:hypothetical protein
MRMAWLIPLALLGASGCKKTAIDPKDATPPVAEIKLKDATGKYVAATATTMNMASGEIEYLCTVTDDQGVQSTKLAVYAGSNSCTVGSSVYSGKFQIEGLPKEQVQTLSSDKDGKVLTKLPLFGTLKGPLGCTVFGSPSQQGEPYGAKATVQCSGTNWSADPAKRSASTALVVSLK